MVLAVVIIECLGGNESNKGGCVVWQVGENE